MSIVNKKRVLCTVGYSGYFNNFGGFVDDLKKNKVNVLIDVRSNPYSIQFPEYNKDILCASLDKAAIIYRNYADEFGAKQTDKQYYSELDGDGEKIDYEKFVKSEHFVSGVSKLNKIYQSDNNNIVALMCSEKDPATCHRAIMVGRTLNNDFDFKVGHIISGGVIESQEELEIRIKESVTSDVRKKHKNKLEEKLYSELVKEGSLFDAPDKKIINDISLYYRVINARIGWKLADILGHNR